MKKIQALSSVLTVAGLMILSQHSAIAADAKAEITTARVHAGFAASAPDLATAQKHLHHVMNCLAGPSAPEFDASAGNPCKDQGMGAIPDSGMAEQKMLQGDMIMAKDAAAQTDLMKAKEGAATLQASLNKSAGH
jgi:hypothetical protein